MHSIIIQVSQERFIKDDWLIADDFIGNGFVGSIADYVVDRNEEERLKDIEWLKERLGGIFEVFNDGKDVKMRIITNGRQAHFKEQLAKLKSMISVMTLDEFCNGTTSHIVSELIDDKYSFYIHWDGIWQTVDSFIRQAAEGEEYYIGGTLDYHA